MGSHEVSIQDAAKELGRSLVGRVPHVVSVTLRRAEANTRTLDLCVDVDSDSGDSEGKIPRNFKGHKVRICRVDTPRFARTA